MNSIGRMRRIYLRRRRNEKIARRATSGDMDKRARAEGARDDSGAFSTRDIVSERTRGFTYGYYLKAASPMINKYTRKT